MSVLLIALTGVCAKRSNDEEMRAVRDMPALTQKGLRTSAFLSNDDRTIKTDDLGPRRWKIIDIHEHVGSEIEVERLLSAMDRLGIERTCLMGSPLYTLTLNRAYGFERFKENNEAILRAKRRHPDRMCAFVTVNPADQGNLDLLKDYVARGADGLKLYLGHGGSTGKGPFHSMRLDDPRMEDIFAWAEKTQFPIMLHVNLAEFWQELVNVLNAHPCLRVDIPHFGLDRSGYGLLSRLGFLLDKYPNVFTDTSVGYTTFQTKAFEEWAAHRNESRAFFMEHSHRIMFGADMVVQSTKTDEYILDTPRSYMQFLESKSWRYFAMPAMPMYGLALPEETLKAIYEQTPRTFLLMDGHHRLPDRSQGQPARVEYSSADCMSFHGAPVRRTQGTP